MGMTKLFLFLAIALPFNQSFAKASKKVNVEVVEIPAGPVTPVSPGDGSIKFRLGSGTGSNVDKIKAQRAIDIMNKFVNNGCLLEKFMARSVTSLKNVEGHQVKNKTEAYNRFLAGAPYDLDIRFYTKKFSKVIGYTYNWLDGYDADKCYNKETPVCKSETKIYSNTNIVYNYSSGDLAAHWTHELSHQARAGGFVHWTVFNGSGPYELGYSMDDCVNAPTARSIRSEQVAPSNFFKSTQLHLKEEMAH